MNTNYFFKKNIYELLLCIITLALIIIFFYSHGNISTDLGREAMIPFTIKKGLLLYDDILNIYGPLSYYINAGLFTIFGTRLETLYVAGSFCSLIFIFSLYYIAKFLFEKKIAFLISLFVAISCMFNSGLYNFIFPYSYAVIYGLTFYTLSLLFLLIFNKNRNNKYLYLSLFCSSLAFANKIEFFPAAAIIIFLLYYIWKASKKEIFKYFFLWISFSTFLYSLPFIFGISLYSAKEALRIFTISSTVQSVKNFAIQIGTIFTPNDIFFWIKSFIFFTIYCSIGYILYKKVTNLNKKILAIFILAIFHYFLQGEIHFSYVAVLVLVYLFFKFNEIKQNSNLLIITLFALGAALKTFYKINIIDYGAYTIPLLLIVFVYICQTKIPDKNNGTNNKALIILLLSGAILSNLFFNLQKKMIYSYSIETSMGKIQTCKIWAKGSNDLLAYIKNNTKNTDKILFLPEGSLFNFLSKRDTNMQIYALNMPYIETYGSKKIIETIKNSNFEIIILLTGFGLYHFDNPNFYFSKNDITDFLNNSFETIGILQYDKENQIVILKRKKQT